MPTREQYANLLDQTHQAIADARVNGVWMVVVKHASVDVAEVG